VSASPSPRTGSWFACVSKTGDAETAAHRTGRPAPRIDASNDIVWPKPPIGPDGSDEDACASGPSPRWTRTAWAATAEAVFGTGSAKAPKEPAVARIAPATSFATPGVGRGEAPAL